MSDQTGIEWADATWNPVTGCTKVSPGCDHCYAETFAERWRGTPGHYFERGFDVQLRPEKLNLPLRWKKPRRIFVNSMSDLFHDDVPDEYIAKVFAIMALASQHTFQVLTKRHGRMRSLLNDGSFRHAVFVEAHQADWDVAIRMDRLPWPLLNVWLGVSTEDQKWADIRVPALLDTPAAVRWISAEPLLGPVDLSRWVPRPLCAACVAAGVEAPMCNACYDDFETKHVIEEDSCRRRCIDWVVVGGESGPDARPMHPAWARSLRDQCLTAEVPFLFKQHGAWAPVLPDEWQSRRESDWLVRNDGYHWPLAEPHGTEDGTEVTVRRVGKGKAGRTLDGELWDQYPGGAS